MEQLSFSEAEYNHKKRKTRREKFLEQMEELIPWKRLEKHHRWCVRRMDPAFQEKDSGMLKGICL